LTGEGIEWFLSPTAALVSFLGMLASFGLSLFLYFRGKKEKRPYYARRSFNLARGPTAPDGVQVMFRGRKVDTLTVTNLLFANGGREAIRREDNAPRDPLRIAARRNGVEILEATLMSVRNPANGLRLDNEDGVHKITFDFLQEGEGGVFRIYHTGTQPSDIGLDGSVIGPGSPRYEKILSDNAQPPATPQNDKMPRSVLLGLSALAIVGSIYFEYQQIMQLIGAKSNFDALQTLVLMVAFPLLLGILLRLAWRRVPPRGYEKFEEEFRL
jgi:hypothetical protein